MSYRLKIDDRSRIAGRFIARVRRELQKVIAEERTARGLTQNQLAKTLGVDRAVVNRRLIGEANLTLRTIADFAWALNREIVFHFEKPNHAALGGANYFIDASAAGGSGSYRESTSASRTYTHVSVATDAVRR